MKQLQPKPTPESKIYKVVLARSKNLIEWPGHIVSTAAVEASKVKNEDPNKPLVMYLTTLDGWLIMEHQGKTAVSKGGMTCVLEDDAF